MVNAMASEQSPEQEAEPEGPRAVLVQGVPVDDYPAFAPEAARGRVLRVTEVGEDVLHHPCATVGEFGSEALSALIDDMFRTMYVADGVGLAANQVGVGVRLFVYDCPDGNGARHVGHILNPVLDDPDPAGLGVDDGGEGCLSVPGPVKDVARPASARVRGVDRDGEPLVLEGTGYFARCLQHETDHTNGRLYIDLLGRRERKEALNGMAELREGVMQRRAARETELRERLG
jgi:peptide deformylase